MDLDLIVAIEKLIRKAPPGWLLDWCLALQNCPVALSAQAVLGRMPPTNNGDLALIAGHVIGLSAGHRHTP
jgi:hypothetical protein